MAAPCDPVVRNCLLARHHACTFDRTFPQRRFHRRRHRTARGTRNFVVLISLSGPGLVLIQGLLMYALLYSVDAWIALLTLAALEIVLGIDNIIFLAVVANKVA